MPFDSLQQKMPSNKFFYFKTSGKKSHTDPDKIYKEIFPNL
jgi:hypothetical protein